jgi:hypothetical protein
MKRNMDVIRSLLLRLEELPIRPDGIVLIHGSDPEIAIDGHSADEVDYHLKLLKEQGLIECPGSLPLAGGIPFRKLTWAGHDFVDAVRDPAIWKKTKHSVDAIGSITFDLVKDLAKGFIKTKIEEHTGVKL